MTRSASEPWPVNTECCQIIDHVRPNGLSFDPIPEVVAAERNEKWLRPPTAVSLLLTWLVISRRF